MRIFRTEATPASDRRTIMLRTLTVAAALCIAGVAVAQPQDPAPNQYLVLIYETPAEFAARSGPDAGAYWGKWDLYGKEVASAVRIVGGGPLKAPSEARSVQERAGQPTIANRPYQRGTAQVSGYFLVEAPSIEAATAIAAKSPSVTSGGGIEVRPIAPAPTMMK
jgi:hypothetical protein